jgi:hypothetical protein
MTDISFTLKWELQSMTVLDNVMYRSQTQEYWTWFWCVVQILASLAGMKTFWVVGYEIQEERANMVDVLAEQEKIETSVQATNGVCLLCPYYVRLKSEFYP